jgi:hypothetical protein
VLEGSEVDLAAAGADLLAGRRRAADHLGPGHHARPAGVAAPRLRQNLGIYRQQVIGPRESSCAGWRTAAARWTSATSRAANPGQPFPIAVALGADPATILGAVTPVPDTLSEYQFAGLLRGSRTELVDSGVAKATEAAGAGQRRDRARGPHPAGPPRASRAAASTACR